MNVMIVERKNNEIVVRFSVDTSVSKIQSILDYLRYEELTSKSSATESDIKTLTKLSKKGRWEKIKKEIGLDD
jgi:hypothetical protein